MIFTITYVHVSCYLAVALFRYFVINPRHSHEIVAFRIKRIEHVDFPVRTLRASFFTARAGFAVQEKRLLDLSWLIPIWIYKCALRRRKDKLSIYFGVTHGPFWRIIANGGWPDNSNKNRRERPKRESHAFHRLHVLTNKINIQFPYMTFGRRLRFVVIASE